MKITIFYPNNIFESGGIGNWIYEVATRLSENNEVTLLGSNRQSTEMQSSTRIQDLRNKVKCIQFGSMQLPIGVPIAAPFFLRKIINLMRASDVIYFIAPSYPNDLLLAVLRRLTGKRIIVGFHGQLFSETKLRLYFPILKLSLRLFDGYHVLNNQTYDLLKCLRLRNVFLTKNGVDTKVFRPLKNAQNDAFEILFVGWLVESKGILTLLEVARRLNKFKTNNLRILICGSGPYEQAVLSASKDCALVKLFGYIPTENMPAIYANAKLFILPSKLEGMPLSLLEAQSCGLPIVASRIPGIVDATKNYPNYRLVEVNDIDGFVKSTLEYYELWQKSPAMYTALMNENSNFAEQNIDWSIIVSELGNKFLAVLGKSAN